MSNNEILVKPGTLQNFLADMFTASGMPQPDAAYAAECMVQTNLWGIDSHGVLRAPIYLQRLRSGAVNATPNIKTVKGAMGLELVDGDGGLGYVVGRTAMNRAIDLAEQYNIGMVGAVNSNHFGAAALFARMATEKGMLAIVMTNVIPNIVAPGGGKPITGNNPIAFAAPTFGEFPFMLDISLSNVAGGKLLLASKQGKKIPLDWATDKDGRPTDDPAAGFAGFLLPVGGHKGLGLSYFVDILCGVITGGVFQHQIKSMYKHADDPSLTAHQMIVINPQAMMSRDDLKSRMAEFYQTIKTSPMWDESKEMLLPGELEYRTAQARQQSGIPVPANLFEELQELAVELKVSTPLIAG